MILNTEKLIKGQWGKLFLFGLIFSILYTGYGCTRYRQVSMDKTEFMTNKQIQGSLADYHLYLHDGNTSYQLLDAQILDQKDISGKLAPAAYKELNPDWKRSERKAWWNEHKYDIHIYTSDDLHSTVSMDSIPNLLDDRVMLSDHMIKEVRVMGIDKKAMVGAVIIVIVVVVGAALITLITVAAIGASNNAANNGSGRSDSNSDSGDSGGSDSGDSGGSDSGSNNSGGSDSGSSNSGGSDSGSSDSGGSGGSGGSDSGGSGGSGGSDSGDSGASDSDSGS